MFHISNLTSRCIPCEDVTYDARRRITLHGLGSNRHQYLSTCLGDQAKALINSIDGSIGWVFPFKMTPLERACRALCKLAGDPSVAPNIVQGAIPPAFEQDWRRFIPHVQAVLEALRQPNFSMVEAADKIPPLQPDVPDRAGEWQAMIEAALKE